VTSVCASALANIAQLKRAMNQSSGGPNKRPVLEGLPTVRPISYPPLHLLTLPQSGSSRSNPDVLMMRSNNVSTYPPASGQGSPFAVQKNSHVALQRLTRSALLSS
jgi:hypothetical protein